MYVSTLLMHHGHDDYIVQCIILCIDPKSYIKLAPPKRETEKEIFNWVVV